VTPGKLGLVYAGEDTRRLIRLVGVANTKDILFTARLFQAEEALTMGLINRLSPRGEALGTARSVGEEMAALSQWSVRATKAMIAGLQSGWDGDGAEARALHLDGFTNEDFTEGYRAFLQKRPPKFSYS
jgi:enoyl-CoA hydratase/carnithine racemase